MATEEGGRTSSPIIRVGPVTGTRWTVSIDDDPTPLSEHETREEAEAAARAHAESFGYPEILVTGLDGAQDVIIINDPGPRPGYPGAARGESAT